LPGHCRIPFGDAAGMLVEVWVPDEHTSALRRRVARRAGLVRARTRVKNEIHAVLARCLIGRPPVSDLFGKKGRAWLAGLVLPEEESQTVTSGLRHIDFLDGEVAALDQEIARQALARPGFHRLLTIPGIDVGTAATVIAAIGEIDRFGSLGQLIAYLGLDPKVRQSGSEPVRYGTFQSAATRKREQSSWRRPGELSALPVHSARSASESEPAAARRSRQSRLCASSSCSAGTCSPRRRTTPFSDRR
jgi:transposase